MTDAKNTEKSVILNLYGAFGAGLVLSMIPHGIVSVIALLFWTGILITAYSKRKKSEPNSLVHNHTTYLIRTVWIGALISVITLCAGGAYVLSQVTYDAFEPCAETFASQGIEALENAKMTDLMGSAEPCLNSFVTDNSQVFLIATIFSILPILLYFVIRFVKGLVRAMKGYRIADPQSWL